MFAHGKIHPGIEKNFETFLLYWLDADVNKSDQNKTVQMELRSIVNHLKVFDDQSQCQQTIESLSAKERLIFIVSGRLGRQIVPQIHQLRQLSSIYIYCSDKALNEEWARHYTKIREVIVELNDLLTEIKSTQRARVKIKEPISYNIYAINEHQVQSTTELNKNFIHSLVLINALLRYESNPKDKQELISMYKKEYKNDKNQLGVINEFSEKYTPNKALWWYTHEPFFYKQLNKALCAAQNNFELWLLFRSYISNIYEQLKQNQCKSPICVYYGEIMCTYATKYLQDQQNRYLSINSFLLTHINRDKVFDFLNNAQLKHEQQQRVLFIIDADPDIGTTKSFADISKVSNFIDDGEILFMIGCVFRLIQVTIDGSILTVRMQLCGDDERDFEHINESMKKIYEDQNEDNKIDLRTFGSILHRMGKYDLAERIYHRLLDELPSDDSSLFDLHCALGAVTKEKSDYNASLESYQKSLKIKKKTNPSDFITIGRLYGCIGEVYLLKKNDKDAFEFFNKAIKLYQTKDAENHPYMADFHHDIASIYNRQQKYAEALESYQKALRISGEHLSSNRLSIAKSHNGIGNTYFLLKQYDLAMKHYQQSLVIRLEVLPSKHHSTANSYKNIGSVYKMIDNLEEALTYYRKAAIIYREILPAQHPDVIEAENEIQDLLKRLK